MSSAGMLPEGLWPMHSAVGERHYVFCKGDLVKCQERRKYLGLFKRRGESPKCLVHTLGYDKLEFALLMACWRRIFLSLST